MDDCSAIMFCKEQYIVQELYDARHHVLCSTCNSRRLYGGAIQSMLVDVVIFQSNECISMCTGILFKHVTELAQYNQETVCRIPINLIIAFLCLAGCREDSLIIDRLLTGYELACRNVGGCLCVCVCMCCIVVIYEQCRFVFCVYKYMCVCFIIIL